MQQQYCVRKSPPLLTYTFNSPSADKWICSEFTIRMTFGTFLQSNDSLLFFSTVRSFLIACLSKRLFSEWSGGDPVGYSFNLELDNYALKGTLASANIIKYYVAPIPMANCCIMLYHFYGIIVESTGVYIYNKTLLAVYILSHDHDSWVNASLLADYIKNADMMWKQSVWSSTIAGSLASKFMKQSGILTLTGASPATAETPGIGQNVVA